MTVKLIETFKVHIVLMQVLGFSISQNRSKLYKLYSFFVITIFIITPPILTILNIFMTENLELFEAIHTLFLTMQLAAVILQTISLLINLDGVGKSFDILKSDLFNQHYFAQESLLHEATTVVKRNTFILLSVTCISIFIWALIPIFTKTSKLPMDVWLPFDINNFTIQSIVYMYVVIGKIYAFSCLLYTKFVISGVYIDGVFYSLLNTLFAGLIIMASAQLRVLKNTLSNLEKYAQCDFRKQRLEFRESKSTILYERIRNCVKHHQAVVA